MQLNLSKIVDRANVLYGEAKYGDDLYYRTSEIRPLIRSDQVKAAIQAIVEAINHELFCPLTVHYTYGGDVYKATDRAIKQIVHEGTK